jgi:hypothetical protein
MTGTRGVIEGVMAATRLDCGPRPAAAPCRSCSLGIAPSAATLHLEPVGAPALSDLEGGEDLEGCAGDNEVMVTVGSLQDEGDSVDASGTLRPVTVATVTGTFKLTDPVTGTPGPATPPLATTATTQLLRGIGACGPQPSTEGGQDPYGSPDALPATAAQATASPDVERASQLEQGLRASSLPQYNDRTWPGAPGPPASSGLLPGAVQVGSDACWQLGLLPGRPSLGALALATLGVPSRATVQSSCNLGTALTSIMGSESDSSESDTAFDTESDTLANCTPSESAASGGCHRDGDCSPGPGEELWDSLQVASATTGTGLQVVPSALGRSDASLSATRHCEDGSNIGTQARVAPQSQSESLLAPQAERSSTGSIPQIQPASSRAPTTAASAHRYTTTGGNLKALCSARSPGTACDTGRGRATSLTPSRIVGATGANLNGPQARFTSQGGLARQVAQVDSTPPPMMARQRMVGDPRASSPGPSVLLAPLKPLAHGAGSVPAALAGQGQGTGSPGTLRLGLGSPSGPALMAGLLCTAQPTIATALTARGSVGGSVWRSRWRAPLPSGRAGDASGASGGSPMLAKPLTASLSEAPVTGRQSLRTPAQSVGRRSVASSSSRSTLSQPGHGRLHDPVHIADRGIGPRLKKNSVDAGTGGA